MAGPNSLEYSHGISDPESETVGRRALLSVAQGYGANDVAGLISLIKNQFGFDTDRDAWMHIAAEHAPLIGREGRAALSQSAAQSGVTLRWDETEIITENIPITVSREVAHLPVIVRNAQEAFLARNPALPSADAVSLGELYCRARMAGITAMLAKLGAFVYQLRDGELGREVLERALPAILDAISPAFRERVATLLRLYSEGIFQVPHEGEEITQRGANFNARLQGAIAAVVNDANSTEPVIQNCPITAIRPDDLAIAEFNDGPSNRTTIPIPIPKRANTRLRIIKDQFAAGRAAAYDFYSYIGQYSSFREQIENFFPTLQLIFNFPEAASLPDDKESIIALVHVIKSHLNRNNRTMVAVGRMRPHMPIRLRQVIIEILDNAADWCATNGGRNFTADLWERFGLRDLDNTMKYDDEIPLFIPCTNNSGPMPPVQAAVALDEYPEHWGDLTLNESDPVGALAASEYVDVDASLVEWPKHDGDVTPTDNFMPRRAEAQASRAVPQGDSGKVEEDPLSSWGNILKSLEEEIAVESPPYVEVEDELVKPPFHVVTEGYLRHHERAVPPPLPCVNNDNARSLIPELIAELVDEASQTLRVRSQPQSPLPPVNEDLWNAMREVSEMLRPEVAAEEAALAAAPRSRIENGSLIIAPPLREVDIVGVSAELAAAFNRPSRTGIVPPPARAAAPSRAETPVRRGRISTFLKNIIRTGRHVQNSRRAAPAVDPSPPLVLPIEDLNMVIPELSFDPKFESTTQPANPVEKQRKSFRERIGNILRPVKSTLSNIAHRTVKGIKKWGRHALLVAAGFALPGDTPIADPVNNGPGIGEIENAISPKDYMPRGGGAKSVSSSGISYNISYVQAAEKLSTGKDTPAVPDYSRGTTGARAFMRDGHGGLVTQNKPLPVEQMLRADSFTAVVTLQKNEGPSRAALRSLTDTVFEYAVNDLETQGLEVDRNALRAVAEGMTEARYGKGKSYELLLRQLADSRNGALTEQIDMKRLNNGESAPDKYGNINLWAPGVQWVYSKNMDEAKSLGDEVARAMGGEIASRQPSGVKGIFGKIASGVKSFARGIFG